MGAQCSDTLEIAVKPTLLNIIIRASQALPALVSAIGLLKYQDEIHEFFFKKRYQYLRPETVVAGELF